MHKDKQQGTQKLFIKSLLSYVSKLKKQWSVAVYDPITKRRAVANSLPEAIKKLGEKSPEAVLVIIDQKTSENINKERDE